MPDANFTEVEQLKTNESTQCFWLNTHKISGCTDGKD